MSLGYLRQSVLQIPMENNVLTNSHIATFKNTDLQQYVAAWENPSHGQNLIISRQTLFSFCMYKSLILASSCPDLS